MHWGPFVRQEDLAFGLVQEISVQPMGPANSTVHPKRVFLYDKDTLLTFISCETMKQQVPPFATFSSCYHDFIVPELKVVGEAIYSKTDLYRWREIETEIKKIVHSFVVQ